MKRRTKTVARCWPKVVLLLSNVATLLSIGCLFVVVRYFETGSSDSINKIKTTTTRVPTTVPTRVPTRVPTSDKIITNVVDCEKMLKNISTHLQFQWVSVPRLTMSTNSSVSVQRDKFIVPFRGLYYVYSNIQFLHETATKCKYLSNKIWKQVVHLTCANKGRSKQIMEAYHTCCDDCERERATSFTAGKVYLNVNDSLHVEVIGEGIISDKPFSFFGLMLLENGDSNVSHFEQYEKLTR